MENYKEYTIFTFHMSSLLHQLKTNVFLQLYSSVLFLRKEKLIAGQCSDGVYAYFGHNSSIIVRKLDTKETEVQTFIENNYSTYSSTYYILVPTNF